MEKNAKVHDSKTESARNAVKAFPRKLDLGGLLMASEEDKEFLLKQRQKGIQSSMLGVDLKLAQTEERQPQKQQKVLNKPLEARNWISI